MTPEDKKEKEIKYLLFLKNELIKQTRKEVKELKDQLNEINGYKNLRRKEDERRGKQKTKRRK